MRTIVSLLLAVVVLQSCLIGGGVRGDGNIQSKEFSIGDYSSLHLSGSARMYYEQKPDEKPYLRIEIDENLIEYLEPRIDENDHLDLRTTKNINPTKYLIYTNSTSLRNARLSGSGSLSIDSGIETDKLSLSISGSGNVKAENIKCSELESSVSGSGALQIGALTADRFRASVSGSGKINASGSVRESDTRVSGSGSVNLSDLTSSKAKSNISGSGKVNLMVNDSLEARVTGSGNVYYKGNPAHKQISVSGSGKVKPE